VVLACVCNFMFVLLSQQNLVSTVTVEDADMKLGRCV